MLRLKAIASFAVFLFFSFSYFPCISARLCQNDNHGGLSNDANNNSTSQTSILFICPRPEDPPHFTDCCFSSAQSSSPCCEKKFHTAYVYGLDDRMLITISVGVIISCLLSSILVLICCFCSKCPAYSICQSKYRHNDTIAFSTKEELMKLNGMPNEDYKIQQGYEPNAVQIRPVHYDA